MFHQRQKKRSKHPELPFKLTKELEGASDGDNHGAAGVRSGKRPASRKQQRKQQRQEKKQRRDLYNQRVHLGSRQQGHAGGGRQQQGHGAGGKRTGAQVRLVGPRVQCLRDLGAPRSIRAQPGCVRPSG